MKKTIVFISKITLVHILTYIACGLLFMNIFSYSSSIDETSIMRDTSSIIVRLAPLFQILRGILFGIVLWIIRNSIVDKKFGWLIIWVLVIILGIINTPAPSPNSIEEFIYYKPSSEAWNIQVGGILEILSQTFLFSLFSWLLTKNKHINNKTS